MTIFNENDGSKPFEQELLKLIKEFAKSKQIEASNKIIDEFLPEVSRFYPYINTVNFNDRKNNGTGNGGSIVVFFDLPVGLSSKDYVLRFKLSMGGKHNGYSKNGDACWGLGFASSYKKDAEMIETLSNLKVLKPVTDSWIVPFNYNSDRQGLKDLIISYTQEIIARKKKIPGAVYKRPVIIVSGLEAFFGEVIEEIEESFPDSNKEDYPFVYKIKRLTNIFTIPVGYEDYNFVRGSFEHVEKYKESRKRLFEEVKGNTLKELQGSSYSTKDKNIRHLLKESGIKYEAKPTTYGMHYNFDTKKVPLKIWLVENTGLMGMYGKGNHFNTKVFQNNKYDFRVNAGTQYGTKDFEDFLKNQFRIFSENL